MKKLLSLTALLMLVIAGYGQSSPGNIGNAGGNNGQPRLLFWLIADSANYNDGDAVSLWPDVSGNGLNLTQSDANFQPQYIANGINGHAVIRFDDANNERIGTGPVDNMFTDQMTVFVVMNTTDAGSGIISYNTSSEDNEFLLFSPDNLRVFTNASSTTSNVDFRNAPTILTAKWGTTSGGQVIIYKDGKYGNSGNISSSAISTGGYLAVGGEQDQYNDGYQQSQAFNGDIAEVIIYATKLNDAQRTIVENYLNIKYAITIDNDYYTANDAAYIYSFSGVGQEADGYVETSSSDGFYVTANLSTLDNSEYLMFAHNNAPNSSTDINMTTDLPAGVEAAWNRVWYLEKTGNTDATIAFDFSEGMPDGKFPAGTSNYVLLYRSGTSGTYTILKSGADGITEGDRIYFNLNDADITNGYYTIGTLDETNSPVEGVDGRSWYTLASGDWDNWEIWTLDPSGALPNNPDHLTPSTSPSSNADKVYILTGKKVTVSANNKQNALLDVEGTIDFGTTTGHSFSTISGSGRIELAADNFPAGDATDFITEGHDEGTVVYYGGSYNLSTAREFYNLEIDLDDPANTVTLLNNYTINGKLWIKNGILKINDDASTTNLNITVKKDLYVENNGSILTGSANARHELNLYGDFTNYGIVKFTNRTAADYANEATDGIVDANFFNDSKDQSIKCFNTTNFYRIEIRKGSDDTYVLNIDATDPAYFNLYGYAGESHGNVDQLSQNNNALGLVTGTVRIGSNINIPVLNNTGNYNVSAGACLWVDGGEVHKDIGTAIVPYGKIKVSAGLLTADIYSGITIRQTGSLVVSGGTVTVRQIRTSVYGATNVGAYVQSGGTVNITSAGSATDYYSFCLTYPGNVFNMSGGTLHIYDSNGNGENNGAIFINSDPENVNVTGGTVICEIKNSSNPFKITSRAPFYNLILRNTRDNTTHHIIDYGNNVGSTDEYLAAQPLVVLNDLTIEDNVLLDNKGQDITVGGDLYISENSQLDNVGTGNNRGIVYNKSAKYTLTFNGDNDQEFYIGHNTADGDAWEWYVSNLIVDKPKDKRVKLLSSPSKDYTNFGDGSYKIRILHIDDTTIVHSGILDQNQYSIRTFDYVQVDKDGQLGIYNEGQTLRWAYIITRDGSITIHTEKGAIIGNLKMNSIGTVTFTSDVYIKRIGYYYVGSMNLQTYKLTVDYLNHKYTANPVVLSSSSPTEMFYTAGNASDGGIEIFVPANLADGTELRLPLGTDANGLARYTPVIITLSNVSDSGYIQIRPSDNELKTTNLDGSNILSYYWRISFRGFENSKPTVQYRFTYDDSDDDNGGEATFVAGKVLDIYPFTRTFEDDPTPDLNSVDETNNYIYFDGPSGNGFTLDSACYTAGYYTRFQGQPDVYYTDASYKNWTDGSIWHKNDKNGPTGEIPQEGSVAIIYRDDTNTSARIWGNNIPNTPAMIIFEINRDVFPDVHTENQPRLQFNNGGTYNLGRVSGPGMVSVQVSANPTLIADWGDFSRDSCATLMYGWNGSTDTLRNLPDQIPNLMFENNTFYLDQEVTVNYDLILNGTPDVIPLQNLTVNRDFIVGFWRGGTLHFPDNGNPVTVKIKGDIDYTRWNPDGTVRKITVDDPGADLSLEHRLIVYGDIIQGDQDYMQLNLFNAKNRPAVILELAGDTSATYTRSSASTPALYKIVMNKGDDQSLYFRFADDFTLNGPTYGTDKNIEMQNGTLIFDDPNINVLVSTGGGDFKIPGTTALELRQGKLRIEGTDAGMLLDGKLLVSGGTLDMAQSVGNANNYIEYSASGNATIEVTAGQLLVGSQIRRGLRSDEGILHFIQSGGSVEIGKNAAPEAKRAIFEILNPGSEFTYTGGTFTIVNDHRSNPSIASLYINPENINIAQGQTITFGNASTATGANAFTLYAGKPLYNLTVDDVSATGTKLTLDIVPLTLEGSMLIANNATLDADGLNITIKRDWTNNGSYLANGNSVYFSGVSAQTITGNTTFYKLYKDNVNTLYIDNSTTITVENYLSIENGLLNTQNGEIIVTGDLFSSRTVLTGTSSNGIIMRGPDLQYITGNGTYAKLMIDNINGVQVPTGYTITINTQLLMNKGVLDIGKNLLVLTKNAEIVPLNPFSETNMIQTNISFTDAGVKKYFPAISSSTKFTYPVGSNGKYTPIVMDITALSPDNTSIRVKSADERHPSIIEDSESPDPEIADSANVLQYYWIMDAENITDFSAEVTMQANPNDVRVTSPYTSADYITARLLDRNNGLWDKYIPEDFNENTAELYFHFNSTNDDGIDGDYTAGVDGTSFNGAIPDQVPLYVSNQDGDWTNKDIWTPTAPAGGPKGARVLVKHHVTIPQNYIVSYQTRIDATGILDVGTTFGHRLGKVGGTGILYMERGEMPAGDYDDFFAADSGTIEFGGIDDYDILSEIPQINNLVLSGSGIRNFPNLDLQLLGYIQIKGATAVDLYNKTISVKKDFIFDSGSFDAQQGKVVFNGNNRQLIKGISSLTAANAFYDLEINNIYGLELQQPADISNNLVFTAGVIYTTETNILKLTNTGQNIVSGAGNGKYVEGPLAKQIINGQSFDFPVGDYGRYGHLILDVDASATTDYWTVEYYNHDATNDGYDVTAMASPLQYVSNNEYWRVKAANTYNSYVTLRWDSQSGVPSSASDRSNNLKMAEWNPSTTQWEEIAATIALDNGENDGLLKTQNADAFNNDTYGNLYTFASDYYESFQWEGDESSDWNTAGNWSGNKVPNSFNDVTIPSGTPYAPVITSNAEVKNLTVNSGATLTVKPGYSLTINDALVNNGTILLEAPNGDGAYPSLLTYGDVTNNGTMQFQLFLTLKEYHYLSSPINGGNATSDLFCKNRPDGRFNPNFFKYDESTDLNGDPNTQPAGDYDSQNLVAGWVYAHNGENGAAAPLEVKKGYAIWDETNRLITFEGTPNNGTLDITGLTYTENDPVPEESTEPNFYDGWHLIGNPYPSYLDWDAISGSLTNVDNAIYVWDGTQYASYVNGVSGGSGNQNRYIAPMQGFFIHTNGANAGFQLNNTHRTHSNTSFLKSASSKQNQEKYIVRLKFSTDKYNDYFAVYFDDSATAGFDKKYDAFKMFASDYYKDIPHLYSYSGQIKYSVEALNKDSIADQTIKLGYKIGTQGQYTISVEQINLPESVKVYLLDKQYDKQIELDPGDSYSFIANAGDTKDRFELKFVQPQPPVVKGSIDKITVYEKKKETKAIDKNIIEDPNKGTMVYEIQENGQRPSWISYDNEFGIIVINAGNDQVGTHNLEFIATDDEGLSASVPFTVEVINVNDAPVITAQLHDTTAYVNHEFSYNIADAFTDIDKGDQLTFSAKLNDGSTLPVWLDIDKTTGVIKGEPTTEDELEITVTATDTQGESASQTFKLVVKDETPAGPNMYKLAVYPNPATVNFTIETDLELPYTLKIISADGKVVKTRKVNSAKEKFDISDLAKGNYMLEINSQGRTITNKLIIK